MNKCRISMGRGSTHQYAMDHGGMHRQAFSGGYQGC